ncbi:MAG: HNH endonuclease [Clostridiales bacterium]|nr:HNH endonuclease [Clostridiales bacterium]
MYKKALWDKEGNNITWIDAVERCLQQSGHPMRVKDIYEYLLKYVINEVPSTAKTPQNTISNTLTTHPDVFYRNEEGAWELVKNQSPDWNVGMSDDDDGFPEGKMLLAKHLYRERNKTLVKRAKNQFIKSHDGKLFCEACGFNFYKIYGDVGKDFIEAHHMKPVSEMREGEKTNISDLVMLCSNCHRMVHRIRPWIKDKKELKRMVMITDV